MDLTNLVSYWGLDENIANGSRADRQGTNTLSDGLTNTGTATGLVYAKAGNFVAATNNVLFSSNNSTLQMGNIDFTICAWIKLSSKPVGTMAIVSKGLNTSASYRLGFSEGSDRFQMQCWGSASLGDAALALANTFGSPTIGTWYFVVGGYDSTANNAFISVNAGTVDVSATQSLGAFVETDEFDIGLTNGDGGTWLDGVLGPVLLWKRLLSGSEVTQLYNSGAGLTYAAMAGATAALTGTITASATEADIVAGGKTIILTITGDTFIP